MRKIISIILIGLFSFSQNIQAQAFQKGNKNIDIGIGFGVYGVNSTFSNSINGVIVSKTEKDGAASSIFPIGFEYGVSQKIGVGLDLTISNYGISDSDRVVLKKVGSVDFGAKFNYHLLNAEKNDLYLSLGIGVSNIRFQYQANTANFIESATGSGTYFSLGITDRIFFTDYIGISFNLGYRGYNYSTIDAELTTSAKATLAAIGVTNYDQFWSWKMAGVHIGTGLAVKF